MQNNSKFLAASILLLSCCTHRVAHTGDGVVTQPGTRLDATLVEPNKPIERELQENQMHAYAVLVPADQVVSGVVDQRGIDVVMRLIDPTGRLVAVVDKQGSEGPEPWTLEPQPAGTWYIEVEPFKPGTVGHYTMRIDETIATHEFAERRAKLRYQSDRMLQLWYEYRKDGAAAVLRFAQEMRGHAPLVEPVPGDPRGDVIITFLWQGEGDFVGLLGGPSPESFLTPMLRFEDTQLWYFSTRAPKDLRVGYGFLPKAPNMDSRTDELDWVPDAWNPSPSVFPSLVELPDAPTQPWAEHNPDVDRGRLVETTIESRALLEPRRVAVYLPPNFNPDGPRLPYVVIFDGEAYGIDNAQNSPEQALVPTPTILDNLIAAGQVPPMLAVFVASGQTRASDLAMSALFCDFLVQELVPWLRDEHHASSTANDAALAGSSLGGLTAAYCAFHHSQVFGNVLSQSGAFWYAPWEQTSVRFDLEPGAFIREIIAGARVPVRFWMEVGMYELGGGPLLGANQLAQNRHLRDILSVKGYDVNYHEYSGGHDYATWRGSLADGLIALFGVPASVSQQ